VGTALAVVPAGRGPSDGWSARTLIRHTEGDAAGVAQFVLPRS
jgi:hypothetical protein